MFELLFFAFVVIVGLLAMLFGGGASAQVVRLEVVALDQRPMLRRAPPNGPRRKYRSKEEASGPPFERGYSSQPLKRPDAEAAFPGAFCAPRDRVRPSLSVCSRGDRLRNPNAPQRGGRLTPPMLSGETRR